MAKDESFDVVSEFDQQEVLNAVDQTKRDIQTRYDLKGSGSIVELDAGKSITITTTDEMKLNAIIEILKTKFAKRSLSVKIIDPQKVESSLGGNVKQVLNLKKGIDKELAKKLVTDIKGTKLKVQASIQDEKIRVSGKNRDDLQAVIALLKEKQDIYDVALQFTNYR